VHDVAVGENETVRGKQETGSRAARFTAADAEMRFDVYDRGAHSFGSADDGAGVGIEKLIVTGEILREGSWFGRRTV
jgi:hypothetical protein